MSASILVTYATKYGSTQEVAEVVATTLRENGLDVELSPVQMVESVEGYHTIVLGAPLYIGHWHRDAQHFLNRHQVALMQRQVAIFTLGPIQRDEQEWEGVYTQLNAQLAEYPWLKPIAIELFGGSYDPEKLRFPDSLLSKVPATPLHNLPATDVRDWAAIRAWAISLVRQLQPVT